MYRFMSIIYDFKSEFSWYHNELTYFTPVCQNIYTVWIRRMIIRCRVFLAEEDLAWGFGKSDYFFGLLNLDISRRKFNNVINLSLDNQKCRHYD